MIARYIKVFAVFLLFICANASEVCLTPCQAKSSSSSKARKKTKAKKAKKSKKEATTETVTLPYFRPYPPMMHPVRIGLVRSAKSAKVAVWHDGAVFVNGKPIFPIKRGLVYKITPNKIVELATGASIDIPTDQRTYVSAPDYKIWTANKWWRGCVEIVSFGNRVNVNNLLDMEEYLLGVVPAEMPATWNLEALKAQAIAARSYAWAHLGRGSKWYKSQGYDLVPDVRDQMYQGLAKEHPRTYQAVSMTRGLVLKHADRVKPGFYRAKVGNPFQNLNIRKSRVLSSKLEQITGVPNIVGVTVKQWDAATGNARSVVVMGQKDSREVYGVALAKMLGFSTAGILDIHEEGNSWVFTCRGPGNGARGLSQTGANQLANRGWRFDQILQQYYQDNDGKLRLDYLDHWVPQTAVRRKAPKKRELKPIEVDD